MTSLVSSLANGLRIARLSGRHWRFAEAIAVRRVAETLCTNLPRSVAAMPISRPVEIVIAVSSVCQLSCQMCGIRNIMKQPAYRGKVLSHADLAPLFREAEAWTPRPYIKFTGGEPLVIGEELFSMLKDCRSRRIPTRVSTNGILLAKSDVANALVESGPAVVTVSLDGPREVHNAVRGRDFAFDHVIEGIRHLGRTKTALKTKSPLVQVSTVLHAGNFDSLKEIYQICRDLPIQWWNVQLLNFVSPEMADAADDTAKEWGYEPGPWRAFVHDDLHRVDPDAIASAADWIKRQRSPFAVSFHHVGGFSAEKLRAYYAGSEKPLKKKICAAPFISMHIVPNGDMVFCIDYPYVTYGNIRTDSMAAAWNSEAARRFRDRVLSAYKSGGQNPPQCHRCNWMFN